MSWNIIGHEKQVKFLQKSIERNHLSHAYLFIGPEGVGKMTVALAFAKALECQERPDGEFCGQCRSCLDIEAEIHPDVHLVRPEDSKEGIAISQIRNLQRVFSLSPLNSLYKIGIIQGADLLGVPAANAFLKTLEEPLGKAIFILISASEQILPTISSRCQILKFPSLSTVKVKEYLDSLGITQAERLARASLGRPGFALSIIKNPEILKKREALIKDLATLMSSDNNYRFRYVEKLSQDKGDIREAFFCWTMFFRDRLMDSYNCPDLTTYDKATVNVSKQKSLDIIKELKKTYDIIFSTNVNPRLALEVLMLNL